MKNVFGLALTVITLSFSEQVIAQSFVDNALLFSRTNPAGSARIQSLGGAQTSLGGDYSSALSNPAGLGMFNKSEFTFSPGLNFYNTSSSYLETSQKDSKTVFNIPGLSFVLHQPQEKASGFLGGSFGISMTRTNDFNNVFRYRGENSYTSIIDYFIEDAEGFSIDPRPGVPTLNYDFPTGLAYDNYLIQDSAFLKPSPISGDYIEYFSVLGTYPDVPGDFRTVTRSENAVTKGAQYQWSIAYGGNFSDRFFFGASLGITTLRYKYQRIYTESEFFFELDPAYNPLNSLELEENIDIKGSGVNLTVGLIGRPVDFIQVGISYVTPTYYQITDNYTAAVRTKWNNFDYYGIETLNNIAYESSEPIISEYALSTPMKFSTGITFFIGKQGFITGDVEFVNYAKAKYDSQTPGESFDPENTDIRTLYKNVINYRLGAEYRYDIFRFRAGYNFQANPYVDTIDIDKSIQTFSAGAGIRLNQFYVDLTLQQSKWENVYSPYVFKNGDAPLVKLENKIFSSMMTVGFTF
ncbi:MAG: outer membrane protein transport protein [Cyclobacteriaceae bacterium]|nr:outer membrane protein transport protein [Cyclobacteriaceae bacterium]